MVDEAVQFAGNLMSKQYFQDNWSYSQKEFHKYIWLFKNGRWPGQFQYQNKHNDTAHHKCVCVWIDVQVLTFWWSVGLPSDV